MPLALHYIELLAGMGQLASSASATHRLVRLLEDVDADGVWHPKNLRSQPKPSTPVTYHCWPLAPDDGGMTSRQADITFRLAQDREAAGLAPRVFLTMAGRLDLTPFGFTPTEGLIYEVLLTGGPGTGYTIARAAGLGARQRLRRARGVGGEGGGARRGGTAAPVPSRAAQHAAGPVE